MTPLGWASASGFWEAVILLVNLAAKIDHQDNFGMTPLFHAMEAVPSDRRLVVAKLLLDQHANKEHKDNLGKTPLFFPNCVEKAKLLLDRGARINQQDDNGMTPLGMACWYGRWEIVKFFLDQGATFDHQDNSGETPLDYAVQNGHPDIVYLLVQAAAQRSNISYIQNKLRRPTHQVASLPQCPYPVGPVYMGYKTQEIQQPKR